MTINNLLRVSANRAPAYDMCPNRSVRPKTGVPDCSYQHGMSCIEEQESKFGGKQRRTENDRGRVFRSGFWDVNVCAGDVLKAYHQEDLVKEWGSWAGKRREQGEISGKIPASVSTTSEEWNVNYISESVLALKQESWAFIPHCSPWLAEGCPGRVGGHTWLSVLMGPWFPEPLRSRRDGRCRPLEVKQCRLGVGRGMGPPERMKRYLRAEHQ